MRIALELVLGAYAAFVTLRLRRARRLLRAADALLPLRLSSLLRKG